MNIKDKIQNGSEIHQKAYAEYKIAFEKFTAIVAPIEDEKRQILNKFKGIINKKLKDDHKCDCCRPRYYDEAWFTEEGITLRIDADHPNDILDCDWSWDEVEEIMEEDYKP